MPALADGRCFTTYLASCQYDQTLQTKFNQVTASGFREFLQDNAMIAQEETRKLHVCAFAFDSINTGPKLATAMYQSSTAPT